MIDDGIGAPVCSQLAVLRMCRGAQYLFDSCKHEDDTDFKAALALPVALFPGDISHAGCIQELGESDMQCLIRQYCNTTSSDAQ